jgi:hypothetical protein
MKCKIFDSRDVFGGVGVTKYCSCKVKGGARPRVGEVTIDIQRFAYFLADLNVYLLSFAVPLTFFFLDCFFGLLFFLLGSSTLLPPSPSTSGIAKCCF